MKLILKTIYMTGNDIKDTRGFTLVEVLMVLAVFSVSMLMITSIFMMAVKAQRRSAIAQNIQSTVRFAVETMAEEIRMDAVDYNYYGPAALSGPQDILSLIDIDGNQIMFRQNGSRLEMSDDAGGNWAALTPAELTVTGLKFFIAPEASPFAPGTSVNIQPRITIVLAIHDSNNEFEEQSPIFLQTTVSSRVYKR